MSGEVQLGALPNPALAAEVAKRSALATVIDIEGHASASLATVSRELKKLDVKTLDMLLQQEESNCRLYGSGMLAGVVLTVLCVSTSLILGHYHSGASTAVKDVLAFGTGIGIIATIVLAIAYFVCRRDRSELQKTKISQGIWQAAEKARETLTKENLQHLLTAAQAHLPGDFLNRLRTHLQNPALA